MLCILSFFLFSCILKFLAKSVLYYRQDFTVKHKLTSLEYFDLFLFSRKGFLIEDIWDLSLIFNNKIKIFDYSTDASEKQTW